MAIASGRLQAPGDLPGIAVSDNSRHSVCELTQHIHP